MKQIKQKFFFYLWTAFLPFLLVTPIKTQAAVISPTMDADGSITGIAGARYYNIGSWRDMFDTYTNVSPNQLENHTVFLNIVQDIHGSSDLTNSGTTRNIRNDISLNILGNGFTLYVDNDTNYSTGLDANGQLVTSTRGGFRANNSNISENTVLKVSNAQIVNNITGGIFQAAGRNAKPTFIYKNIQMRNGANYGAQPIRNDEGRILFFGENIFDILQNQDMESVGLGAPRFGADNQGEWIQGGRYTEVVEGKTTVNYNWGWDQPFYTYNSTSSTLKVNDNAQLIWNMNDSYTMYYDDLNTGALLWEIGENASFIINGTQNTAARFADGWFYSTAFTRWDLNVGKNAELLVSTGGGQIGIGGAGNVFAQTIWNFEEDSRVLFNNLSSSSALIGGRAGSGSAMNLNNPQAVTFNTNGGRIMNTNIANTFPIAVAGEGLRTHASSSSATFDGTFDLLSPNKINLGTNDIWYRQNTGTIHRLDNNSSSSAMSPTPYTQADVRALGGMRYLSWFKPIGYWIHPSSNMSRSFDVDLADLSLDGEFSDLIAANEASLLEVGDDRGQSPDFTITITMEENLLENGIEYHWIDPQTKNSNLFEKGQAMQIVRIDDDNNLPNFVAMSNAGRSYAMNFPADTGISIKANVSLMLQENTVGAIFNYSINNGPG